MNRKRYAPSDPNGVFRGALIDPSDPALTSGLVSGGSLRPIGKRDASSLRLPCVVIRYAGKGANRRVRSVCLASVDVGQVTDSYADAWVRSETPIYGNGELSSYPIRFEIGSGRLYVIDGKGNEK